MRGSSGVRFASLVATAVVLSACANVDPMDSTLGGEQASPGMAEPIAPATALRNVIAAAKTYHADHEDSFQGLGPEEIAKLWDGVCYQEGSKQAGTCLDGAILVQIAATDARFGAAALNEASECLWISDGPDGVLYGAGFPCTGKGAMDADGRRFP